MEGRCRQELCPNWSGDGRVCPCALFDLDPDVDPFGRSDEINMEGLAP